jgi:chorismate lyase/3-hydroxybenzoate synthase
MITSTESAGIDGLDPHARSVVLPARGATIEVPSRCSTLLTFEFGRQQRPTRPGQIATGVVALSPTDYKETWLVPGETERWMEGGVGVVLGDSYMCVHTTWDPGVGQSICHGTESVYREMITVLSRNDFRQLARAWNFIPEINLGEGDNERYRQFCLGRANALDACGVRSEDLPAATAVGVAGDCLMSVAMIATRVPATHIENPRQLEAYNYPRQYGPRGPSFSRGTLLNSPHDGSLLLTSGTASIRGHESIHSFDAPAQIDETLTNLDRVMQEANRICGSTGAGHQDSNLYRVYLRDRADLDGVSDRMISHQMSSKELVFLQADICRRELGVEIEGVQYL